MMCKYENTRFFTNLRKLVKKIRKINQKLCALF